MKIKIPSKDSPSDIQIKNKNLILEGSLFIKLYCIIVLEVILCLPLITKQYIH